MSCSDRNEINHAYENHKIPKTSLRFCIAFKQQNENWETEGHFCSDDGKMKRKEVMKKIIKIPGSILKDAGRKRIDMYIDYECKNA